MPTDVLVAQDLSCVGQVSMSVALPLLGAAGLRPTVLPTALLSTHTGGFGANTYLDLSSEIEKIIAHWHSLNFNFSAVYLGYLGQKPLEMLLQHFDTLVTPQSFNLIDPVMGDNGHLYHGFDSNYIDGMRQLISKAQLITPNVTEAALLLGKTTSFKQALTLHEAQDLLQELAQAFNKQQIVLTGVHLTNGKIAVLGYDKISREIWNQQQEKIPGNYFGTGDIFASVLFIMLLKGSTIRMAVKIAMEFVSNSIQSTLEAPGFNARYGVNYAPHLPQLLKKIAHIQRRI
ncbi:pyridoxamine kinase [Liquorilactobacillus uvarum]|uniref:pyridoxal kinase n=1 Tax=Liquorilactobacillus uvarum DSM 19971 TaxID=1423812 RepID=A0A0R1Q807_9LACO|nr:pyridoxamine kinase [Liquorilactobacillus uvarum]KRL38338.1 Pyridoxal kinase [Liquorilactobacillus uvarum DSM 19971]